MTRFSNNRVTRSRRRGAALVEFSLVLPLLMLLLVGSIEIGRAINVRQTLGEATRAGARVYSMQTSKTKQDATDMVDKIMQDAGLEKYKLTFTPESSAGVEHLDPLTVEISITAEDASWYPSPWFLGSNNVIAARCVMPADLGKTGTVAPQVAGPSTGPIVDTDEAEELSGLDNISTKNLDKEAAKLVKEAVKLRKKADKQLEKAEKKFLEAQEAKAKGDQDKYEDKMEEYAEEMEKWRKLDAEAYQAEQEARAALAKAAPTT